MISYITCFHTQWEVFFQIKFYPGMKFYSLHPRMKLTCTHKCFHPGRVSSGDEISSRLHVNALLEGVYTWNFIPGWNSSREEIISVDGEMSLTVYRLLPRWNFILGWKKEKRMCKHFVPGRNFKMSMFWRMYSNMLSKFDVFEHNESMNIIKRKASL